MKFFFLSLITLFVLTTTASEKVAKTINQKFKNSGSVEISQECVLVFGFTEWKPLQYISSTGTPVGLQVDLTRAILDKMNCKLEFKFASWTENMKRLKSGEVDFIANATDSVERRGFGIFSLPYRKDEFTVFVKQEDRKKYNYYSIDDLKKNNFRLGLAREYLYGKEIENWQQDSSTNKSLSYVEVAEQNIERLFKSEIDGFLEDPLVISYKLRSKDLTRRVVPLPIRTFGREVAFMFSKKNFDQTFIDKFNNALRLTLNEPEHQSIWIVPELQLPQ